jgi:hypothetical protein
VNMLFCLSDFCVPVWNYFFGGIQVLFVLVLFKSAFSCSVFVWHEVMSWLVNSELE